MSFRFEDATIDTRKGERRALVLTPITEMRVGRARLKELRESGRAAEVDGTLIDRLRFATEKYDCVVFRGRGDDPQSVYRLADTLSVAEQQELTQRLVISQLRCWRTLVELGVTVVVHSEFGSSALPFRDACRDLADDPERDPSVGARVAGIDEWILRHMIFFFSQNYEATMTTLLPDKLPLIELRREKLELFAQVLREEHW